MVEEITERRRAERERQALEAELRQAQKMEAVGRMTGGIAHDFNNLLSIIIANADLIAPALATSQAEVRSDLAELRHAGERGAAMIRKLLGFSRYAEIKLAATDIADLLNSMRGMLRHIVPEHIALEVRTSPGTSATVDPMAVEQMVLNLATNARDAMQTGGTVRIDAAPVVVGPDQTAGRSWMRPGEFVRLSVTDTGTGMDDVTKAKAFDPFFTTKPLDVGTGLGLSMVYGLVKQQQGYIDIWSEPGKGTIVNLYFPKAAPGAPATALGSSSTPIGGDETILLIEDDDNLRSTTRRVLERLGYRVMIARDGTEGIALYRENPELFDLVFSDTVMPGMTGPEVYHAIREENSAIPFVLASGYDDREVRSIHVPEPLTLFRKPWTIEELDAKVREALDEGSS
jgi:two-component system, cell cycle sensor histidine kinase and response regulator CckA